jgi:hypothetical protein
MLESRRAPKGDLMPVPTGHRAALLLLLGGIAVFGNAQTAPPPAPTATAVARALGELVSIDPSAGRLSLKTDAGTVVAVAVDDKTQLVRAQPGAADLREARPMTLGELALGDRVLARGRALENGVLLARQAVVMASSDIAAKHEGERREWMRRGIAGVVKAVDPKAQEITLETRGLAGGETVLLPVGAGNVIFKRYAPDSVRFADARPSALAEIQPGDQLRALGERSADRTRFVPEQVVTGAFRSVTATVEHVSQGERTLAVSELGTRARLLVTVAPGTVLKRLTDEVAARLARRRLGPGQASPQAGEPEPAGRPTHEGAGPEGGGRRRFAGNGGANLGDMLDQLPVLPLADLKDGEIIVFSSTRGADATHLTAIALVAGLDALVPRTAPRAREGGVTLGLPAGALDLGMEAP